jgi:hypothetical protein
MATIQVQKKVERGVVLLETIVIDGLNKNSHLQPIGNEADWKEKQAALVTAYNAQIKSLDIQLEFILLQKSIAEQELKTIQHEAN